MMATRAENEGFRMLDEFICDAVPGPGIPPADSRKQGCNEGMLIVEEIGLEAAADRNVGLPAARTDKERVAGAVLEAQIRLLLRIGRMRFGPPEPGIESVLKETKDLERVERMAEAVLTALSWRELLSIP